MCNEGSISKPICTVTRGLTALVEHSKKLGDGLHKKFTAMSPLIVHHDCRLKYLKSSEWTINNETVADQHSKLRSSTNKFNFKEHCFYCGEELVNKKVQHNKRKRVVKCEFKDYIHSVRARANDRNDKYGDVVLTRLQNISDLISVDAEYHKACSVEFFTSKKLRKNSTSGGPKNENKLKSDAFGEVCKLIENNTDRQYSII